MPNLHIARGNDWTGAGAAPITSEDWRRALGSTSEFEERKDLSGEAPAGTTVPSKGDFAVWTGHSTGELVPLFLAEGRITILAFDAGDPEIRAMANVLARLLEGRLYDERGKPR